MYLGCEVKHNNFRYIGTLIGPTVDNSQGGWCIQVPSNDIFNGRLDQYRYTEPQFFKLILRRLSDMTEEEAREFYDVVIGSWEGGSIISRKMADGSIEIACYDKEEDDNPSEDEIFEEADQNENLLRIETKRGFNFYKGWEHDYNEVYGFKEHADAFAYLLSKRFDLFGLIKAGEAIDAKTL